MADKCEIEGAIPVRFHESILGRSKTTTPKTVAFLIDATTTLPLTDGEPRFDRLTRVPNFRKNCGQSVPSLREISMEKWPVGVFTSIDAGLGVDLAVAKELGIPTIQIHAPHPENRSAEAAAEIKQRLSNFNIVATAVVGGFDGESYADIPTVVRTVGLVPPETRQARLAEMKSISDFAKHLDCGVIALHLGFVPHDTTDPLYQEIIDVTRELCDHAKTNGQNLHLETGQETAEALVQFLDDMQRDNIFVNFDPANMILYGTGEPIEALQILGSRVRSVHFKDATWGDKPGEEWGQEVRLGDGDVNIDRYMETLQEIGFEGPLTIEREIPQEPQKQKDEIGHAVSLIKAIRSRLLPG